MPAALMPVAPCPTMTPKVPDPADKGLDQFQPVNRRAGYDTDKLDRILAYLGRWPAATLASGEGAILAAEIHRLRSGTTHGPETP